MAKEIFFVTNLFLSQLMFVSDRLLPVYLLSNIIFIQDYLVSNIGWPGGGCYAPMLQFVKCIGSNPTRGLLVFSGYSGFSSLPPLCH